jgi:hypothetical protein
VLASLLIGLMEVDSGVYSTEVASPFDIGLNDLPVNTETASEVRTADLVPQGTGTSSCASFHFSLSKKTVSLPRVQVLRLYLHTLSKRDTARLNVKHLTEVRRPRCPELRPC